MERILILNSGKFPDNFDEAIDSDNGKLTISEVEGTLVRAINDHNAKIRLAGIEYLPKDHPLFQGFDSAFMGLIVEKAEYPANMAGFHAATDAFIENLPDRTVVWSPAFYVILSSTEEGSRNALFSQQLFPAMIEAMRRTLPSSCYGPTNHPVLFVNILNKVLTARSPITRLATYVAMGFEYIEVFNHCLSAESVPRNMKDFCEKYDFDPIGPMEFAARTGECKINCAEKLIEISAEPLRSGGYIEVKRNGVYGFQGSHDKFYFGIVIPILVFGLRNGYKVDYSDYEDYLNVHGPKFNNSDKIKRCYVLLDYLKKIDNIGR